MKFEMRKGGYLSQNGEWISYKTNANHSKLAVINTLADDFLCTLDEEGINYDADSLRIARARLTNYAVLMVKSSDTSLPYEQSAVN